MGSRRTRGDIKQQRERFKERYFDDEELEEKDIQTELDFKNIFGEDV